MEWDRMIWDEMRGEGGLCSTYACCIIEILEGMGWDGMGRAILR